MKNSIENLFEKIDQLPNAYIAILLFLIIGISLVCILISVIKPRKKGVASYRKIKEDLYQREYWKRKMNEEKNKPQPPADTELIRKKIQMAEDRMSECRKN